MRGWTKLLAALLGIVAAGCDSGPADTDISGDPDGGPDTVPVNLDGGGEPAAPPDGEAACPQGICNYQSGEGCTGPTTACIPGLTGGSISPVCQPEGPGQNGATCSQATDCAAGFFCAENSCHKLCCGSDWTGCPSESEHCIKSLAYSDGMGGALATGAMLCYPVNNCNALVPTSCSQTGTTCQIADPTGATACLPEGSGGAGEPCPCKGGFTCVVGETGSTCVRLCKAVEGGGEPYCQPGEGICTHYVRDPPGVGECVP